jgi:hypothetical protein
MAFNNSQTKNKNQFVARLVSNRTQATVSWTHITDDFARKVFGVANATEVTAKQAMVTLPLMFDNDRVSCVVTDLTVDREAIPATDF